MLWQRVLTALVGIPIGLYIFYTGGVPFLISIIILTIIGQKEMIRIIANRKGKLVESFLFLSGIIFCLSAYYLALPFYLSILLLLLISLFSLFIFTFPDIQMQDIGLNLIIMIYPGFLFSQLILLRNLSFDGYRYILLAFLLTWASDTFAYFVGRSFGKNKLAPAVSPAKTIEGSIGGILGAILAVIAFNYFYSLFPIGWAILIGIAGSAIAQLGDLFESGIKRLGNVKDSGSIMPGHGGVLDRFDSILFVGPVIYLLLQIIKP